MDDNVGEEEEKLGRCGAHTRHAAAVRPCADADVEMRQMHGHAWQTRTQLLNLKASYA